MSELKIIGLIIGFIIYLGINMIIYLALKKAAPNFTNTDKIILVIVLLFLIPMPIALLGLIPDNKPNKIRHHHECSCNWCEKNN